MAPKQEAPIVLTGTCRCGAITYSSTTLPTSILACHCLTCRRLSGSPYLAFAQFPLASILINIAGLPTTATTAKSASPSALVTTSYSSQAARAHCALCGTPIHMQYAAEPDSISFTAGTIDEESVKGELPKLSTHIFLNEKARWFDIPDDGAKRYERFPSEGKE